MIKILKNFVNNFFKNKRRKQKIYQNIINDPSDKEMLKSC